MRWHGSEVSDGSAGVMVMVRLRVKVRVTVGVGIGIGHVCEISDDSAGVLPHRGLPLSTQRTRTFRPQTAVARCACWPRLLQHNCV